MWCCEVKLKNSSNLRQFVLQMQGRDLSWSVGVSCVFDRHPVEFILRGIIQLLHRGFTRHFFTQMSESNLGKKGDQKSADLRHIPLRDKSA